MRRLERLLVAVLLVLAAGAATLAQNEAPVRVVEVLLVDDRTGEFIETLGDGTVVDLAQFASTPLAFLAITEPAEIGAVRFYVDGLRFHQADEPPYAASGADASSFTSWPPDEGTRTLVVVPVEAPLAADGSLSDAMNRGEVGPWFEADVTFEQSSEAAEAVGDADATDTGGNGTAAALDEAPDTTLDEAASDAAPAEAPDETTDEVTAATPDASDEVMRYRWPLGGDNSPIEGTVLLNRYPGGVLILTVTVDSGLGSEPLAASLQRAGCTEGSERIYALEPVARAGLPSATPLDLGFATFHSGQFGLRLSTPSTNATVACTVLDLDQAQ